MGVPMPGSTSGALFGATGAFLQMPDGSIVNFAMTSKVRQEGKRLLVQYPNYPNTDSFDFKTETIAANMLTGIADFLTTQSGILTLKSITPATGAASTTINAVLLGTGFQYDLSGGVFNGGVTVDVAGATVTFVNSNTLLLQFTAPVAGAYDVTYTPAVGSPVVLTGAWTSV